MADRLRRPRRRECERCGRVERWQGAPPSWCIAVVDGERRTGDPACIHEWDIDGSFDPVARDANG